MKKILVIGSTGQIGSELTVELRRAYGGGNVVAGYIAGAEPRGALLEGGPAEVADVTDGAALAEVVRRHDVDAIFNLAALLSVVAEEKPRTAWRVGIDGLWNVLEVARERHCQVFTPSSIGAFGPGTPPESTPQDTVMRPQTVYGVSKVTTELLSDWFFFKYGVDTRSVRFPGLISHATPPGGGTTDYAVDIFYSAVRGEEFRCPIPAGVRMDMMYMADAIAAATTLMEADPSRLRHRNGFNVTAMSLEPEMLRQEIAKHLPDFKMTYDIDPLKERIARSWPDSLDDTAAREEWGWTPRYDLSRTTAEMLARLRERLER